MGDYAIRFAVLSWPIIFINRKRNFEVRYLSLIILPTVLISFGIIFTYSYTNQLLLPIIFSFTNTGFTLTYSLILAMSVPGIIKLSHFLKYFSIWTFIFFTVFGFIQFYTGKPIRLNESSAMYLYEGINYLIEYRRMTGLFETSSHITSAVIGISLCLLIAKSLFKKIRYFEYFIGFSFLVGIILCLNRINIIAIVIIIILQFLFISKSNTNKYIILIFSVGILIIVYLNLNVLLDKSNIDRLYDSQNVTGRLEIFQNFLNSLQYIWSNYQLGLGFFPDFGIGGAKYYEKYIFSILGENQILFYISNYGIYITLVIIFLIIQIVLKLYNLYRLNPNWICLGLIFSWIYLIISFSSAYDTRAILPMLYVISAIFLQEQMFSRKRFIFSENLKLRKNQA